MSQIQTIIGILTASLFCSTKFIIGIFMVLALHVGLVPSLLATVGGGMGGVYFYAFIGLKWREFYILRKNRRIAAGTHQYRKVKFNKSRRRLIYLKMKFGIAGIALLTPILLQVPIGTLLAMRIVKNVHTVGIYMFFSFMFYATLICGAFYVMDINLKEVIATTAHRIF